MNVYWTQFAEGKLEDIYLYYCEKVSERIATRLVNEIINRSLELEKSPQIGQKELLLTGRLQEFRYLVFKSYKIIYFINHTKRRIEIVNLFDCRQDPQKISEI